MRQVYGDVTRPEPETRRLAQLDNAVMAGSCALRIFFGAALIAREEYPMRAFQRF